MNNIENTYLISQHTTDLNHVGLSSVQDLADVFVSIGINLINVLTNDKEHNLQKKVGKLRRPYSIPNVSSYNINENANLIIICSGPFFLHYIKPLYKKHFRFKQVAVYIMDGFNSSTMDGFGSTLLDDIDHIFTLMEEAPDDLKNHGCESAHYLPYAIDALTYASIKNTGIIDVLSYGRISSDASLELEKVYNDLNSDKIYIHSTLSGPTHIPNEHKRLHWKMLLNSTINLCFEGSDVPRFCGRSPILYRWLESIAAGNVIVGKRPKCKSMSKLFFWENATIEIGDAGTIVDIVNELLADKTKIAKIKATNKYYAVKLHDWRYRIKTILSIMNIATPLQLSEGLKSLEKQQENLKSFI